jgi:tRNA pseudouridine38-40 synthase
MALYKLILAYDGTNYVGFQRQKARKSVQMELETALKCLGWQGKAVLAAGRTDCGVHASGQVISFDLDWRHGDNVLLRALNAHLPDDIAAQSVCQAAKGFHPRYDALDRTYRYQVYCQLERHPLKARYAWRLWPQPEVDLMNRAAADLIGEHDFKAFGAALKENGTTIRQVFKAVWYSTADGCCFEICANAFLYHMVRRMAFLLVQVGHGKQPQEIVRRGLETGDTGIVALAPACGLTLTEVRYKE